MINHNDNDENVRQALAIVERKRGYVLSYHQLFAGLDTELLLKYDAFYEALTLQERYLTPRQKEIVWIAILAIADEEAGSLHLDRAAKAGVTTEEIAASITIANMIRGFSVWPFVEKYWSKWLPDLDALANYNALVEKALVDFPLEKDLAELVFIGAATAIGNKQALSHHLIRANTIGIPDELIAEAMSFIIIPCGGNQLMDMTSVLSNLVKQGQFKPMSIFGCWE